MYVKIIFPISCSILIIDETGISNGQNGFSDRVDGLAQTFFPWKNPQFAFGDAAFWIVATVSMLMGIVPGVSQGVAIGVGAFMGAGIQQTSYSLQPE